ncbi:MULTISPECIES: WxL domain-containing protein [Leuconostoc]|uniref:WxL domain-containing protein n=1 Tax=Leuconostoc pseudomesenteroides TaxID=33968 RepID=A0A5B8T2V8_LEUPS|nr:MULTISPECIES: WxL domain-containing protein [Leuconostoc]MCC8439849.1 hypothetical protein [Leuconostoc pseudomesenteroides]MDG9733233.1 WxL domain-containing protein [Leuconostoc pseudomesenteroides]MDN2450256.1 hypothetical protein [Leuconostoc sp. UCMA20149]NKZ36773.1 hypothetical protein [Leuconostoc pseudomesenteroides]QEA42961.1 hypothetical protein FGL85_10790 [Leuconostoc pseudomesenteroides]
MTKNTQKITAIIVSVALTGAFAISAPLIANAAVNDTVNGTTSLTLTGDTTALTLDSVPSFAWGSMTTTAAQTQQNITGTGDLQVTDGRGGSTGYTVTAVASNMTSGDDTLPVTAMSIDTTASSPLTGATGANILTSNTVLSGGVDSNGTLATTASTGHITVGNAAKTGTYSGTITYTINDGGLE